ncbi:hypothetical protein M513_11093 [Trichuris suis]|uniref:Uncharacterized protein n=1 Tax=Trichuris suis TaxID=68888 RepID=A0A085LSR5_9BILA|nr:hypothetical protein M513_11093 [Trichuris suis]
MGTVHHPSFVKTGYRTARSAPLAPISMRAGIPPGYVVRMTKTGSVTSLLAWHGRKLELSRAVQFIYCWSQRLTSVRFCMRKIGMGKNAAIEWNMSMRAVAAQALLNNPVIK